MRVDLSQMAPRDTELAIDAAEYDLSTADRAAAGSGRVGHLRSEYASLDRAACADEMRWGRRELTAYDGLILPPRTGLSLAAPETVSPTRLEEYARCPYRYFLHHVLGLVIEQDAAELDRISPIERGALAHRVLERFFRAQQQKARLPIDAGQRDMLLDELRGFLNHEAEAAERRGVVGYPLTWRIDRERLLDDLIAALDHEMDRPRDLVPECFELRFGSDGGVGFVIAAGRRISFRGRIDRLDTCAGEQRARVVDYKTGRGGYKDDTFEGGQRLQLPVYLLAARAMRGYPMENLVAEYCMINRESNGPAVFRGETLQERESDFRVILSAIADGVESGLFPAWPAPTADCSRCDYRRVCGRVGTMSVERKLGDPRLEGLHRMRAINGKD
jgi:RecB family exonuclease